MASKSEDLTAGSTVSLDEEVNDNSNVETSVQTSHERGSWGNQFEFFLTCVGFAVGLGNLWRFPYLAYRNGGGAFLIPYVLMLFGVGVPLFYMELAFGQFASLGPITIWKINGLFKGAGWASVLVTFSVALYYNVIIAYCIFYFCASFTSTLPWNSCDNEWNTINCLDGQNSSMLSASLNQMNGSLKDMKTPSQEYFYNYVLNRSSGIDDSGELRWQLSVCLLVAWVVVFCVLIKGIKSLGKVMYFAAIFPYVLLTILLVRGVTLEGSSDGLKYYLTPEWHRLADSRVWSDAAVQIFYSLGCCTGANVAMASFNKFNHNCRRDALLVPFINCATSVFAGLVVFSMLGFMAHHKGVPVSEVANGGPGLVFVVYPEGISKMPVAPLWSAVFFLMMMTLGFSSQFSLIESVISAIADEFKSHLRDRFRRIIVFRATLIVVAFLLGLPMCLQSGIYLLNLVDVNAGGYPLLVIGLVELIAIGWIYGFKRFEDDIGMMLGSRPGYYWSFTWRYVSPAILLTSLIFLAVQHEKVTYDGYEYPTWALILGWFIGMGPIVLILVWAMVWYCKFGGAKLFHTVTRPSHSWGPALAENRTAGPYVVQPTTGADVRDCVRQPAGYINNAFNPRESNINSLPFVELKGNSHGINVKL